MKSPSLRITMTKVILLEGATMRGQMMKRVMEEMSKMATEAVMGRMQMIQMEERMKEMMVLPMLDGQRLWQKSWGRKPLRAIAASW